MKQILEAYVKWKEENPDEDYRYDEIGEFLASQSRGDLYSLFEDLTTPATINISDHQVAAPKVRYFFISYSCSNSEGSGYGNATIKVGGMFNRGIAENMLKTDHGLDSAIILFFKELTEREHLEMSFIKG